MGTTCSTTVATRPVVSADDAMSAARCCCNRGRCIASNTVVPLTMGERTDGDALPTPTPAPVPVAVAPPPVPDLVAHSPQRDSNSALHGGSVDASEATVTDEDEDEHADPLMRTSAFLVADDAWLSRQSLHLELEALSIRLDEPDAHGSHFQIHADTQTTSRTRARVWDIQNVVVAAASQRETSLIYEHDQDPSAVLRLQPTSAIATTTTTTTQAALPAAATAPSSSSSSRVLAFSVWVRMPKRVPFAGFLMVMSFSDPDFETAHHSMPPPRGYLDTNDFFLQLKRTRHIELRNLVAEVTFQYTADTRQRYVFVGALSVEYVVCLAGLASQAVASRYDESRSASMSTQQLLLTASLPSASTLSPPISTGALSTRDGGGPVVLHA